MWFTSIVIFSFLRFINGVSFFYSRNGFELLTKEMIETMHKIERQEVEVQTNWIEQPVDHFDERDNRKWNMKYFESLDFWKADKPIYLFLGGESDLYPVFIENGLMFDLAKETNGAMFAAEHRYYGDSKPFEDLSTEHFKYLSSRQALADYAKLLESIKALPKYKSSKVVVVGGSYSGNLAAWMKMIYPNLVDAAIASSAPVLAKKDFFEYLEVVSSDFKKYGTDGCWDRIAQTFTEYEQLFKTDEGIQTLKQNEEICDDCDMRKSVNQQNFFLIKATDYMLLAQYGNPNKIQEFCTSHFNSNILNLKQHLIPTARSGTCYNYDINNEIEEIKNKPSYYAWIYQTCTEFGYFQTSASDLPFTKNIFVDLYVTLCTKLFGPDFDENKVDRGVEDSNKFYGGLSPNVSNVVFVNGDMDPWSRLSVLEDISHDVPAKVISQSSHCRDLYSDTESDPEELKEARKYIRNLIKSWIGEA